MQTVRSIFLCAFLGSLIWLVLRVGIAVDRIAAAVVTIPTIAQTEIQATRTDLVQQIAATRTDLTGQIAAARKGILAASDSQLTEIRQMVDNRLGDSLARVDAAIAEVRQARTDIEPALTHTSNIAAQIDDAAPLFLDCDHNPDCAFNRFQGTSKAIERMSQAAAKAAPEITVSVAGIAKNADGIAADAKREADSITQPKKKWERALGPVYTVARIIGIFW